MMTADKDKFKEKILGHLNQYLCDIQDSDGNWTVKGFIDIFKNVYTISLDIAELTRILSVIKDIEFILQEKYKIATDRPGSGNTKNIGSTTKMEELRDGTGIFSKYGVEIFDDYWMYYQTKDMAQLLELPKPPYRNIKEYFEYKQGAKTDKND